MKTILLPFHDDDIAESALQTAHAIANRYGSHIEGLFVIPQPQIVAGHGFALPGVYLTQMAEDGRKLADAAHERFARYLNEHDLALRDIQAPSETASASWREMEGLESQIIGDHGRLFDLVVIGRTAKYDAGDWNIICEAALFECGRPVLVVPEQAPETIGENIVIYWNCSKENARTISLGMRFLENAKAVTVVSALGALVPGPSGEELADHLKRHGIAATADSVETKGGAPAGAAVLAYAKESGADLFFKGAYTHTRLRQMIFGGATREILTNADYRFCWLTEVCSRTSHPTQTSERLSIGSSSSD